MSNTNTGGPAFPLVYDVPPENVRNVYSGMTLRDYFAIRIFQSRVAINSNWTAAEIAAQAYKDADAMLEARQA